MKDKLPTLIAGLLLLAVVAGGLVFKRELQRLLFGTSKEMVQVRIESDPRGAEVESSEGRILGKTPLTAYVHLTYDEQAEVIARKPGYHLRGPVSRPAKVGERLVMRFIMTPLEQTDKSNRRSSRKGRSAARTAHSTDDAGNGQDDFGFLLVRTVPIATIKVDEEVRGRSGSHLATGKFVKLAEGQHTLTLESVRGPRSATREFFIEAGKTEKVQYNFIEGKWDLSLDGWL